jgi:hypothetical protein
MGKKSKYIYGAFPRTKEGKEWAGKYKKKLQKEKKGEFIIE